ncbi:sensor histidine kinase [Roseofilum casamattae]|uniref:histidine kinase n=1 Tax=Roseofilum casamattae BLCC-M143 TaxID=3022442 RepID=A0ABT7BTM4_9CYAN|nr:HAMP domain-containing sensor histidine kinase [Roseofilum casamattae]MDJ1181879.1 HAMP domain-containing sensor histidine kinase [Roseofilum casamattae BLCC-M143]
MFQATRRRLAIWYTTVTAILLLCFAIGIYEYVRATLIDRIDDTLNHVVEVVERSLILDREESARTRINLEISFPDKVEPRDDDRIDLEWFSPTGELLWSTWESPLNIPLSESPMGQTVQVARSPGNSWDETNSNVLLRQMTDRVQIEGELLGYLRASHPWFEVTKPTRKLLVDLVAIIGITVICVAAIGWFLSGIAMEPVRLSYLQLKQFTSDASHELRNPIATIQTNVQVALADPNLDRSDRHYLDIIERLSRRMGRLVNDLLFLARQDSGMVAEPWQPVPLDALAMQAVEEQNSLARSRQLNLQLTLESAANTSSDDEPFTIGGNEDQLMRLFTNLISNALQYTSRGGEVEVSLRSLISQPKNPGVEIQIKDNGIGIAKADIPYLFDRFYRVDPSRRRHSSNLETEVTAGSGLGLAIVKAIVDNHRGSIKIESQPTQGTTITVVLPV